MPSGSAPESCCAEFCSRAGSNRSSRASASITKSLQANTRRAAVWKASGASFSNRLHSGARKVQHFKRLYLRRGEPFAVAWGWFSPSVPKVSRELVAAHTTYHLFESFLHLKIRHADLSVRARAANAELRKLLRLRAHAPVIALERVSYLADGKPAEFTLYCANAENYEFALRIRGKVPITTSMQAVP